MLPRQAFKEVMLESTQLKLKEWLPQLLVGTGRVCSAMCNEF